MKRNNFIQNKKKIVLEKLILSYIVSFIKIPLLTNSNNSVLILQTVHNSVKLYFKYSMLN